MFFKARGNTSSNIQRMILTNSTKDESFKNLSFSYLEGQSEEEENLKSVDELHLSNVLFDSSGLTGKEEAG